MFTVKIIILKNGFTKVQTILLCNIRLGVYNNNFSDSLIVVINVFKSSKHPYILHSL